MKNYIADDYKDFMSAIGAVLHRPTGSELEAWKLYAAALEKQRVARRAEEKAQGITTDES